MHYKINIRCIFVQDSIIFLKMANDSGAYKQKKTFWLIHNLLTLGLFSIDGQKTQ